MTPRSSNRCLPISTPLWKGNFMNHRIFIFMAMAAAVFFNCKSIPLESRWLDRTVTFTGKASEWNDLILYPKDSKVGVGVMNDDTNAYLCLISWDPKVSARITRRGFTAWFTTKSGKGKGLGVHYPVGMAESGWGHGINHDSDRVKEKMKESLEHIELLGPGKEDTCPTRTIVSESMGIVARTTTSEGNCVYELKVPLNIDSVRKFAIGVAGTNDIIQMELETSAFESGAMKSAENESAGGTYGGGAMGGHGGSGMRGGGHGGRSHAGGGLGSGDLWQQFNGTFSIKLSSKPVSGK